ncbi:MAG: helix-turn-helix domain-containing protein [Myxococcales bacterium]
MPEKPEKIAESPESPSSTAESFGRYLMRERELRGISLEQVAESTRIWLPNLKFLEQDDYARLPEKVFVVGYIRAYAKCVGLNGDEAVLRFEEQFRKTEAPHEEIKKRKRSGVAAFVIAGAVLALGAGGWLLFKP